MSNPLVPRPPLPREYQALERKLKTVDLAEVSAEVFRIVKDDLETHERIKADSKAAAQRYFLR